MMKKMTCRRVGGGLMMAGSLLITAATAAQIMPAGDVLEEIVVTARKRAESLQDVPVSVAAFSGEQLEQRSIESLEDLGQTTPNFHFSEQPNGGRLGGIAFIRGVGQRDANSAYDPAVGIYVDGVYMGRAYGSNLDLTDIERVEVLRGPQGTLFGKNTSGGAISIVTRQPDLDADAVAGHVQATTGSYHRLDLQAGIDIPVAHDRAALRLSAARNRRDGFGQRIDGQDMANTDRTSARSQLLIQPTDDLSILLSGDWLDFDERNAAYRLIDVNTRVATVAAYNNTRDPDYDDRWVSHPFRHNATGPNTSRGEVWGGALTLTYDGSWAQLRSISAYRDMHAVNELDVDGAPVNYLDKLEVLDQDQFSQELQASGSALDGGLDWVAGAYYFHEKIVNPTTFPLITDLFGFSRSFTRTYGVTNKSLAFFGQGTWSLTERLRLTGGLRYTEDDKKVNAMQVSFPAGVLLFPRQAGVYSADALSPRVGLDYRWADGFLTYVSVAQGAKNGGFNGQAARPSDFLTFDDEVVWTYEAGLRSDFWDGRARFNATGFYSCYTDLQLQINGSTILNGAPAPFNIITNVPRAHISGGEFELTLMPTPELTLNGALGLTQGKYDRLPADPRFVAAALVSKDSEFSHMPKTSLTLGAEYRLPLADGNELTAHLDYAWRSRIYYNPENTAHVIQPGYGLLNGRITLNLEGGLSLSAFATNLTDKDYIVGGYDDANTPNPGLGLAFAMQGAPREVGISARYRF